MSGNYPCLIIDLVLYRHHRIDKDYIFPLFY
nr:MAG TPA: hypothetical protein [Caudoviricetes sp.]